MPFLGLKMSSWTALANAQIANGALDSLTHFWLQNLSQLVLEVMAW